MTNVREIAKLAKIASIEAMQLSTELKNIALNNIAKAFEDNKEVILNANKQDLNEAQTLLNNGEISQAVFNRLKLDENKLRDMISGVKDIANLQDPINKTIWEREIADGMNLKKISCPLGVIGVIFEARPDVISQISSLAIKSSNAVILKGGKEAENTNKAIFEIITNTLNKIENFPQNMISLIHTRDDVKELLDLDAYVNLIIPRGSNALVKYIKENTKIPVLGHADGICHIYIDKSADLQKVLDICVDAKCQYPSACNSVETILININEVVTILPQLIAKLQENNVEIVADPYLAKTFNLTEATEKDWATEYGEKKVSIKTVSDIETAINHINTFGSGHTDCIITEDNDNAEKFMTYVDSAGVYKNVSTRFADGFRYGFGAEVGISTNKTHARGPVGLEGLTIYKYKLTGNGDIVKDFVDGKREFNKSL